MDVRKRIVNSRSDGRVPPNFEKDFRMQNQDKNNQTNNNQKQDQQKPQGQGGSDKQHATTDRDQSQQRKDAPQRDEQQNR